MHNSTRRHLEPRLFGRPLAALLFAATFSTAGLVAGAQEQTPSAAVLAERIQEQYSSVRDFTAAFSLRQTSPLLPKPLEERGQVKIKKPNRMRWTYSTAEKQEFVSDGSQLYAYWPKGKYVERFALTAENQNSTALLFLAGRGNITRDFVASLPPTQPAGEWQVILTPRSPQSTFQTLTLEVDRTSYTLRGLKVVNAQGGTDHFRFTGFRRNPGLADREFEFTIPRGVEIR